METLLYVSIVSIVIVGVSAFIQVILSSRVKNQTIAEVEQQGAQVVQIITQTLRNGSAINSPAIGTSGSSLSVVTYDSGKNPTIFDLASGVIQIKEGTGSAVPLTSNRIVASGLTFQNLSRSGTGGTVRIQFTLTYLNPQNKNEFSYAKTFYASGDIRK